MAKPCSDHLESPLGRVEMQLMFATEKKIENFRILQMQDMTLWAMAMAMAKSLTRRITPSKHIFKNDDSDSPCYGSSLVLCPGAGLLGRLVPHVTYLPFVGARLADVLSACAHVFQSLPGLPTHFVGCDALKVCMGKHKKHGVGFASEMQQPWQSTWISRHTI